MTALQTSDDRPARLPRLWGPADAITLLRVPLAVAFVLTPAPWHRFAILAAAAATDLFDGIVARRVGSSRAGPVLDPIVDKVFTVTAIVAVATTPGGATLHWLEFVGVVLRDLAVLGGWVATLWLRRRVTIPARLAGKLVTVMQFATLSAILLEWRHERYVAWATAAVSLWAVIDYARIGLRQLRATAARPGSPPS